MHTQADLAGDTLENLEAALRDAGSVALSCLSRDEVGEWLCELQGLRARMDALVTTAAAEAHHAAVPALGGQRTVASYVAANTSSDPKVIAADRNLGLWLDEFCEFADAFHAGVLTRRHVQALRGVDNKRTHAELVKAQDYLVEAARRCGWAEFVIALRYWELAFDPDGEEPDEQAAKRRLSVGKTADGMAKGEFLLDPIAGNATITAIDAEAQRLFRADAESDNERSHAQRYADALVNLVSRGATADGAAPAPLMHIVMSQSVAEDTIARCCDVAPTGDCSCADLGQTHAATDVDVDPHRLPLDPDDVDGRCELIDGTPIHPHWALAALAIADLRRLVMGAEPEDTELSRKTRLYPPHLKQALMVKARGRCETRGCDAPFSWLQADHILAWANGGHTSLRNGQILCDPDNKAKRDRDGPGP